MEPRRAYYNLGTVPSPANKQFKKEGKILEQYHCPQPDRTVFILNYDSAEQWQKDQEKIPILQFCDTEVYPLADFDEYTKASLQSMKAAAKMMAAGAK